MEIGALVREVLTSCIAVLITATVSYMCIYWHEVRRNKRDIVIRLMTNRGGALNKEFITAMNEILVAFGKDEKVKDALDEFHQAAANLSKDNSRALLLLLGALCDSIGIEDDLARDSIIAHPLKAGTDD